MVVDVYVFVVPAHTGLGPSTPQVNAASDFTDRSWFPPEPSRSRNRMWYGDPLGCAPPSQSALDARCPPHASTTVAALAVKLIVSEVEELLALNEPSLTYDTVPNVPL